MQAGFTPPQRPPGTSADGLWPGSLCIGSERCGLLVNSDPPPRARRLMYARARVCVCVCVCVRAGVCVCGGALSAPSVLKHRLH
jgi:hypothetical protein